MKNFKFILPLLAIAVLTFVLAAQAFSGKQHPEKENSFAPHYFKFVGVPGEEDDESKWEEIAEPEYLGLIAECNLFYDGCVIRTDSTQTIAMETRPKLVEVIEILGHKNPIESQESGVTEVGLRNQNP